MSPVINDKQIQKCFQQLKSIKPININKYKQLIDKYQPIHQIQIQPLKIINKTTSTKKIPQQSQLQQEFYQQKFVPSPQLLINYQQTFIKSLRGQQPSPLLNYKLLNLYQKLPQNQNNPYAAKSNLIQQPATLPYHTLTNQYNFMPSRAQNKHVFIEQRQQTILNELKQKTKIGLEMSIPVIEKSLINYEIRNLQQKNISMQNYGNLSAWKSKREQLQNKLNAK